MGLSVHMGNPASNGRPVMQHRMHARLCRLWMDEQRLLLSMEDWLERHPDTEPKTRHRVSLLSQGCQCRASRILGCMAANGGGPLPVPDDEPEPGELPELGAWHLMLHGHYKDSENLARKLLQPHAAHVCELSAYESKDAGQELVELGQLPKPGEKPPKPPKRRARIGPGAPPAKPLDK